MGERINHGENLDRENKRGRNKLFKKACIAVCWRVSEAFEQRGQDGRLYRFLVRKFLMLNVSISTAPPLFRSEMSRFSVDAW
jgi:hypothetical protein